MQTSKLLTKQYHPTAFLLNYIFRPIGTPVVGNVRRGAGWQLLVCIVVVAAVPCPGLRLSVTARVEGVGLINHLSPAVIGTGRETFNGDKIREQVEGFICCNGAIRPEG